MKRLTPTLILTFLAAGAALPGGAEPGGKRGEHGEMFEKRVEMRLEHLSKKLDLSAEQKTKIEALMKARAEKRKAEMEAMKKKHEAERAAAEAEIRAVLTPEQAKKFDELAAKRKEKMKERREKRQERRKDKKHRGADADE